MGCVREGQDKERLHCRSKTVGSPQFEANSWPSFDLWQSKPQSGVTGAGQEEMIRADSAFPETLRQDRCDREMTATCPPATLCHTYSQQVPAPLQSYKYLNDALRVPG